MQQSRQGALCTLEKWGGARSWTPRELSVNKACKSIWLASLSTREGGSKELNSTQTFSKQSLQM
jgi:hypothetical protein